MTTKIKRNHVLEKGHIYFFYRPKVQAPDEAVKAEGIADLQGLYMVLHPFRKKIFRLLRVGKKRLPELHKKSEADWVLIEKVASKSQDILAELKEKRYQTKTRGTRKVPSARPCGEGLYYLVTHENHSHFTYLLKLPEEPGVVQEALEIQKEGSYILSVKNQKLAGTWSGELAEFSKKLAEKFKDRRFIPVDDPEFLNYQGAEVLLIGDSEVIPKELEFTLQKDHEARAVADIFRDLKLWQSETTITPLFKGEWK